MTTWLAGAVFLSLIAVSGPAVAEPWARALAAKTGATPDESLARAARAHAVAIARTPLSPPDDVRAAVTAQGLADAQLETFAAIGERAALAERAEAFAAGRGAALGPTRVGIGRAAAADGREVLVVLWSRRLIELPPLSAVARASTLPVRGTVLAGDRVRAFLTRPEGDVIDLAVRRDGRRVLTDVPLTSGRGRYDVEWLVETARGPEVGALWRFAVDVPPSFVVALQEGLETAPQLVAAIDTWRAGFGLPATLGSAALERAAEQHAAEVCATGVAAHVTARGGPEARARAAGWSGSIAENIAIAPTVARAHAQIVGSPSHRLNLLLPGAVALGVGVARSGARTCVVELFGLSGNRPTASR